MKRLYNQSILGFIAIVFLISCRKFVEIDPPKTSLIKSTVFTNDVTATAAMMDIYAQMVSPASYTGGSNASLSYLGALSADELDLYSTTPAEVEFANNNLTPLTSTSLWRSAYQQIFRANAVLEGLIGATQLTPALKSRLEGEAKFIRAFAHFYLVNLYGDVPLVLTTDYKVNAVQPRTPEAAVYQQIIIDLKDAQNLLSESYQAANGTVTTERKRLNKFAATAMLARIYLYTGNWINAESEATKVINYTALYGSEPIANMFLKNSKEAIWQLARDGGNTNDAGTFAFSTQPNSASLKPALVLSFDNADLRKANWILTRTFNSSTYYQPVKYKATALSPITEYSMILRLGEQYLIRAEARAHQPGKVMSANSAESDLNFIRNRAGIGNTSASNETTMLAAIEQERRFELFTELGHRWLDLKRTNRTNAVVAPLKGTNWQSTDQLYPVPQEQIQNDPAMANQQNPGYQ
ncbi:RagB/SusD family nutrient uptake outer membrane protein [Pedobacter heparinus]|uniref:RagB/SusD family nutrient uptake outer membrane protein n=1 Tax=Pedobacter heparinus TaxID=984 RepID=UPI0029314956|nr:RagB/SusD family nutrient uptake outer membrane protein [Pedobacter heparinus]